jgi:soluble P-type ATPase
MPRPSNVALTRHPDRPPRQATDLCVILGGMSDEDLAAIRAASRAFRRAEATLKQRREALYALVIAAADAKVQQKAIAEATGFTRETIRRIVDDEKKRRAEAANAAS